MIRIRDIVRPSYLTQKLRLYTSAATVPKLVKKKSAIRRVGAAPKQHASEHHEHRHTFINAQKPISCTAYCTARQYDLETIVEKLAIVGRYKLSPGSLADDYVHAVSSVPDQNGDVFFFRDGSMVSWNNSAEEDKRLLYVVQNAEIEQFDDDIRDVEHMKGVYDPYGESGMKGEDLFLGGDNEEDLLFAKLAFSHGLSRSTQLGVLENHLEKYLETIQDIPLCLMKGHEPPVTADEVMKKQGQLLYIRGLLNLHSELVDTAPEFYWSRSDLSRHFDAISRALDVQPRIRVLNQRLDHANRLVDLMTEHLR